VTSGFVAFFRCALCGAEFAVEGGGRCRDCGRTVCRSDLQLRFRPAGYVCDRCAADHAMVTFPLGVFGRVARALRRLGQRET
jgi:hypothetical protein